MSYEFAMLLYARLAAVAAERGQSQGQVRFLTLAGIAATRAGWADIAVRCRELVIAQAPRHLLSRYPSMADALRDADFATFERQLQRFCSVERAEHLLNELGMRPESADEDQSTGGQTLAILVSQWGDGDR